MEIIIVQMIKEGDLIHHKIIQIVKVTDKNNFLVRPIPNT